MLRRSVVHRDRVPRSVSRQGVRRWWLIGTISGAVALLLAGGFYLWGVRGGVQPGVARPAIAETQASIQSSASAESTAVMVEIPTLTGRSLDEAALVLKAAGLLGSLSTGEALAPGAGVIETQDPPAGRLAVAGSTVVLSVAAGPGVAIPKTLKKRRTAFVVCIDPGHQAHSDPKPEPVGPGSSEVKARATAGVSGIQTGIPEYEIVLQIATNLQKRLDAAGVTVVMTRTTNDVDIANSARAAQANDAKADLFVRIHADGSPDPELCGVATRYPAVNAWTQPIATPSRSAARLVQAGVTRSTGAVDRGALESSDLVGFNWSKVPSVLVETGFLSNGVEDKLLSSPHYQDQLAQGMADGILDYLNGVR